MIPKITKETIDMYVQYRIRPGGFVEACLANDFVRAVQIADSTNFPKLKYIVDYLLEYVPTEAKYSYEAVDNWINSNKKNQFPHNLSK